MWTPMYHQYNAYLLSRQPGSMISTAVIPCSRVHRPIVPIRPPQRLELYGLVISSSSKTSSVYVVLPVNVRLVCQWRNIHTRLATLVTLTKCAGCRRIYCCGTGCRAGTYSLISLLGDVNHIPIVTILSNHFDANADLPPSNALCQPVSPNI